VVVVAPLVQGKRVLESGATAALHADAQAHVALGGLACHELLHLLCGDVGEGEHLSELYRRARRYPERLYAKR
jgi:hypothetical protein